MLTLYADTYLSAGGAVHLSADLSAGAGMLAL